MYQKARDASVPLDTIDRAVKRGTGELEGVTYESVTYEGYAPGGVALLIEVLTDNRNRTGPEIRTIMGKLGGSVAEPGAVAWQFERKGLAFVDGSVAEDDIMMAALDAGLEDVSIDGDVWRITTAPSDLPAVREALVDAGIEVASADVTMVSSTTVELTDLASATSVLRLVDALEDHDDVNEVYGNFDIPDALMQDLGS
jgi:YebC/PmpR family DNA-binding regulatory protein